MTDHNLRYFDLGAATALTALGWVLDKITPEVGATVIAAIVAIAGADMIKHRNNIA